LTSAHVAPPRRMLLGTITVESSGSLSVSGEGYSPLSQSTATKTVLDTSGTIQSDSSRATSVSGPVSMEEVSGTSFSTDGSDISAISSQSLSASGETIPKVEQTSASSFSTADAGGNGGDDGDGEAPAPAEYDYESSGAEGGSGAEGDYGDGEAPAPAEYDDESSGAEGESGLPYDYSNGEVEAAGFQSTLKRWFQRG